MLIEVKNLSKIYKQGNSIIKALDNVSLEVGKGDFVAIVGSSGSGKSTLLHILAGVDKASEGIVNVSNTNFTKLSDKQMTIFRRRHIGLIYQFFNLVPLLNVRENILLPLDLDGRNPENGEIESFLEILNLTSRQYHFPKQLSGGQQQRVAIGRALISRPTIILADEPTGNLDREHSNQIIDILKSLNDELKQTIIIVTHDLEIAAKAKRIIHLDDGVIVKDEKLV